MENKTHLYVQQTEDQRPLYQFILKLYYLTRVQLKRSKDFRLDLAYILWRISLISLSPCFYYQRSAALILFFLYFYLFCFFYIFYTNPWIFSLRAENAEEHFNKRVQAT